MIPIRFYDRPAFSLTELVVSIGIFGMLTALVIANFSRGRLADDLRYSAQTMASNLRRIQNLATIGQALQGGGVPPGGYGVSVAWAADPSEYTLFSDTAILVSGTCQISSTSDADSQYTPGASPCDQPAEAGTVKLRPGVVLNQVKIDSTTSVFGSGTWDTNNNRVDIAFQPPKPVPLIDGVASKTVRLELKHIKTGALRTITINGASGQISESAGGIP